MFHRMISRARAFRQTLAAACRVLLPCLAAGLPAPVAQAASLQTTPAQTTPTIAVIYWEADEPGNGDFARIIDGIGDTSDVVVYRMAQYTGLAQLSPRAAAPRGEPVRLAFNGQGPIAVIYPDIGEPYRSIFSKIIEGIEEKTAARVVSYPVGANLDAQALTGELRRNDIRMVIALGRNGLKAAHGLERDFSVVVGGVITAPDAEAKGMVVHSLAPDPQLLFDRLKAMLPGARRVFVVYDPRQNAWLIQLAREAARSHGLELVAQEAADLKTATRLYQELLAGADPRKDALWLPQDATTVEESSVLPMILQEAWNRNLVVFSSSMAHVRRGALFSLYPNNVELGRNLARSALGQPPAGSAQARGVLPLRDVLVAVNVRTAGHLGLRIDARQQRGFDLVFPEQ